MAQSDTRPTGDKEVAGSVPATSGNILLSFVETVVMQFLMKECVQVLANRLEDQSFLGKMWLGKLTDST